jgi:hypothetical protein
MATTADCQIAHIVVRLARSSTMTFDIPDDNRNETLAIIDGISPNLGNLIRDALAEADAT